MIWDAVQHTVRYCEIQCNAVDSQYQSEEEGVGDGATTTPRQRDRRQKKEDSTKNVRPVSQLVLIVHAPDGSLDGAIGPE